MRNETMRERNYCSSGYTKKKLSGIKKNSKDYS